MNEAALSERLRALREPAPRNGFDERLQQALWREAGALRAERGAEPVALGKHSLRRARRWGGRFGLGMIIACGATAAAAAAGGIWVAATHTQRPAPAPGADQQGASTGVQRIAAPASVEAPSAATPPVAVEPPSAEPPAAATPTNSQASDAPAPARATTAREKPRASAGAEPAPRDHSPRPAPSALVPFELPARGGEPSLAPGSSAAERSSRIERLQLPEPRGAAANAEGRALPGLPARADRRSRLDNSASGRGAAPPGLELARERAREKAERGQERAREARERK
jgi:hypothetical protein